MNPLKGQRAAADQQESMAAIGNRRSFRQTIADLHLLQQDEGLFGYYFNIYEYRLPSLPMNMMSELYGPGGERCGVYFCKPLEFYYRFDQNTVVKVDNDGTVVKAGQSGDVRKRFGKEYLVGSEMLYFIPITDFKDEDGEVMNLNRNDLRKLERLAINVVKRQLQRFGRKNEYFTFNDDLDLMCVVYHLNNLFMPLVRYARTVSTDVFQDRLKEITGRA